jgi:uncharacterized protein DUF3857/transglutaminase superfamily protein
MKSIYSFATGLSIFFCIASSGQSRLPEFGQVTAEEINMKECDFDKEAEAVIIFDDAWTDHDDDYSMLTTRRVRIKILNEKGLERGNIIIPFYSGNNFEFIKDIRGVTSNIDASGNLTHIDLDRKSIYIEKRDNYYSLVKFAMPAVKTGSIIEYSFVSEMKHYGGLDDWKFQSDLPTMKSCYMLQVLPTAEFTYSVQKKKDYHIIIKPIADQGKIYFEMNNIPALRFEPFMDAARDYLQRVIFQLSGVINRSGNKMDVNTTWKSTAYDLVTDKEFGGQIDKSIKADELQLLVQNKPSGAEKLKIIYNYVRDNISWNGYNSKYAVDGVKTIWEKKRGTTGGINLLLINLLKSNGIEVYPLLVAERDFGKIDTTYPFLDRFNKVVAFAIADGQQYILDATEKNTPVGLTPFSLLNTIAFLVDKKGYKLLRIASANKTYKNRILINADLNAKGQLHGNATVQSLDYARQVRVESIRENRKEFVSGTFEKPYENISIDSFYINNLDDESLMLEQGIRFSQQLNESGGFVFVNYNLFTGMEKNPFTSSIRFTNVNFGYPHELLLEANIKLPANSKTDDLPKDQVMENNSKTIRLFREIRSENGQLTVKISFVRNTTLVLAEDYKELKEFYKKMVDMMNEPIVVKIGN